MSLSYFDLYGEKNGGICEAHRLFLASWDARYLKSVFLNNTDKIEMLEEVLQQGLNLLLDYSLKVYGETTLDPQKKYPSISWLGLDGVYLSEIPTRTVNYIINPIYENFKINEDINTDK